MRTAIAAILVIAGAMAGSSVLAQDTPRIAAVETVILARPDFSGIVAVSRDGQTAHLAAYGLADRDVGRPHAVGDRWRWSSVTKMVTAILVLQQIDEGKLSLDTPIGTWLPDFPVNADRITVRQLLTHTSGLANPSDGPDVAFGGPDGNPDFYQSDVDWRPVCEATPTGEPGAAFAYNNCDYYVLDAILEEVTGQTYNDLIRARIAEPLGLIDVGVPAGPARQEAYKPDGAREAPERPASWGAAAGIYGTAEAMLAIDNALMDGRLISEASRAEMWKGDPAMGYAALSVWSYAPDLKACLGSTRLIERYGEVGGVQVRNFMLPDKGVAIIRLFE